jgi:copper oxidase (laccase) domain-containing protein
MIPGPCLTFPSLDPQEGFRHAFTLRHPDIDVAVDREEALARLADWHLKVANGLGFDRIVTAQQVHGNGIAVVEGDEQTTYAAVDGLICNQPGILVGIYVADCCAVYLLDPEQGAFGIVHSGKKGTEQNITGKAISLMAERFSSSPENILVQLSPCIRPPSYEVDFAAEIRQQAFSAGVPSGNVHNDGTCTSSDINRFYSYRMEKGRTGRMLALLGRVSL